MSERLVSIARYLIKRGPDGQERRINITGCPWCGNREDAICAGHDDTEDPEEIAPCIICGEPKPNNVPCDCWTEETT